MDRIAYTSEGRAYIIDDSPVSFPPELRQTVIASMKSQGVLDDEISARLEEIEAEMIEGEISRIRDGEGVILNLTRTTTAPRKRDAPFYGDGNNQAYVEEDRGSANEIYAHGMHEITPRSLVSQKAADTRALNVKIA